MDASKPHITVSRITAWVQRNLKKKPEAADFLKVSGKIILEFI